MRARSTLLGALMLAGCAGGTAYKPPPSLPPPVEPPTVAQPPQHAELPPHRFYARPSQARAWPRPQAVAFSTLPAMVQSRKCVHAGSIPEGRPPKVKVAHGRVETKPTPSKNKKKGKRKRKSMAPGHVPYAGNTSKANREPLADATPTATPDNDMDRAVSEPAAESEVFVQADPGGGGDGSGGRNTVGAAASFDDAPSAPPPAEPALAQQRGGPEQQGAKANKRKARRARRKAKRAHDRALAAPRSAAPASMPEPTQPTAFGTEPELLPPRWPPAAEGWGAATFLSNDDTMSLSSAQRVIFAIDEHLPLPPEHIRPHELLNYFSFETAPVDAEHDFSVRAELAASRIDPGLMTLGLAIAGRPMGREGRRNAALTLAIDRSGSMRAEGRMEYLQRGLLRMVRELKDGDIIHVVTFDHRVCNPLRNFVVGRDDLSVLTKTIHRIKPAGNTNMYAGLDQAYQLADASYQDAYTNRVILVTDALANTGVTDARTMSMVSNWYDARRIRLSGIGVGREFNDALLDRLTEKGRGAYVFLGSEAEVDAVFGSHFTSLVETVANDVHFRLHLPPSLRMQAFHGEEASAVKAQVQAVHVFADSSQLMLADLEPWEGTPRPQDDVMLEIEYQDPETGQLRVEDHVFTLGELTPHTSNVRKAEVVMHFIEGIERHARRGAPAGWKPRPGAWRDPAALEDCAQTRTQLRDLAAENRDAEIARILSLWDGYCTRFEGSAGGRPPRKGHRWPSATG
ncbi:MAG: VWA domain-containing protein [Myxococcota bacterium]